MTQPTTSAVTAAPPQYDFSDDHDPPEDLRPRSPVMNVPPLPAQRYHYLTEISFSDSDDEDLPPLRTESDSYLNDEFSRLFTGDRTPSRESLTAWLSSLPPLAKSLVQLTNAVPAPGDLATRATEIIVSMDPCEVDARYGRNAVHWACLLLAPQIVQLLLLHAPPSLLEQRDLTGRTPLACAHELRKAPGGADVIAVLITAGASLEQISLGGAELLYRPDLSPALARRLCHMGADPNGAGRYRISPLMCACGAGRWGVASVLLEFSADIHLPGAVGMSVLHNARLPVWLAELLWRRGADVNAIDMTGETPLMLACEQSNIPYVRWLLAKGARLDAESDAGDTVAECAQRGGVKMQQWLQRHLASLPESDGTE